MDISPKTDREKLIAEASYARGLQDGLKFATDGIIQRALGTMRAIESREIKLREPG